MSEGDQSRYPFGEPPKGMGYITQEVKVPGVAKIERGEDGARLLGIAQKEAADARTRAERLDALIREHGDLLKRANAGENVQEEFDRWLSEMEGLLGRDE